ncbi:hypothetical protein [Bosea beijingensis]|uniref:hypothetical protein n=1 Tax=Bosea beijingensis TaxID=3068632 RepID=UPI002741313E|nr:hypothetical protein [Bosea sp. REN20]
MIAIFTVLGLLLFGGGAYAIYDGWPYMVLERGFTQVIIGSIASGVGLVMLSLAWVLREVRAARRALVEAIELQVQAPLPAVPVAEAPIVVPPARSEGPDFSRSLAPAAIGAVAGAAATSAVAQALSVSEENASAPAEAPASSGERDLFGALVTQKLQEPEAAAEDETADEPMAESTGQLPDMFEEALSSAPLPDVAEPSVAFEAEGHEPAELVAAKVQPAAEPEAFDTHDEPEPFHDEPADEQPMAEEQPAALTEAVPAPAVAEDELDEFSALRASLAGHLNEPEREAGRIEPSFSPEPDPFAAAETWMDRAAPRREPWLDTPPAEEPAPAEEAAPLWPPRTEAQAFETPAFEAPAEPAPVEFEAEAPADAIEAPAHEEPADASAEMLPDPVAVDEPQAEEAQAAAARQPASDEGVVGAYQVGDAHFTIFADGSIRARTPDGEYSFASMDELKVYLASEKSRLGV